MLRPLNDVALVEIESNQYKIGGQQLAGGESKKGICTGIVKELPAVMAYLGFHSFAFESSLNEDKMREVRDFYADLVGKRVYWTALAERGMILKKDDKSYAMIKLTDLIGVSDSDELYEAEVSEIKY